MNEGNLVVCLTATPRALLRRLRNREEARGPDGRRPRDIRPLADVDPGARRWPAAARKRVLGLLQEREPRYAEAPHQVDTTGRRVPDVVAKVVRLAAAEGLLARPLEARGA